MSKLNAPALTEDEIEEELINNDLINSGGIEDQAALQQMDLDEKKNLLHCLKQSKEDFSQETGTSSRPLTKPIIIDTSSSEFPSLPSAKTGNQLKLPRRLSAASKTDSSNSQGQCISLLDDDEALVLKPNKFSLPFCVSDNAPLLPMPDRAFRREECPYYQMRGELAKEALRRMLTHHDSWKEKYNAEMSKLESRALGENIQDIDDKESKSEENGDSEFDPYTFTEVTKVYSGPKKREPKKNLENSSQNSRTIQRRSSRDSDCEEVQPILKPEEPKLGEWLTAARPRNKRNRKQNSNQGRAQSQTDIEFEFEGSRSLWGAGRSGGGPQSPAPARRSIPMPSVHEVQEEKVQCPICQRNFTMSTVVNHAATCEGFSSSPMDVEEGS